MIAKLRHFSAALVSHAVRFADSPASFAVLALVAVLATWSFTVPVGPFLVAFCVARPKRWFGFAMVVNLATAVAAVMVVWALAHGLAPWIASEVPQLMQSEEWQRLRGWVDAGGLAAMLAWLALPLPQGPFVLLVGLLDVPLWKLFVAFLFGKGIKYAVSAWAAAQSTMVGARAAQRLNINARPSRPSKTPRDGQSREPRP
ncbi:MAG TPA: hypothetical protein VFS42_08270 [Burkholderiaceae bacterium]|nr:hypothetical protein [Burkholderiaceae bacterium]